MTLIVNDSISARNKNLPVAGNQISFAPFAAIVQISLVPRTISHQQATMFPVLIDTGFNSNLAIQDAHLNQWAGRKLSDFTISGSTANIHSGLGKTLQSIPQYQADLWLHSNQPGIQPIHIPLSPGFLYFPNNPHYPPGPKFPLLGAKALLTAGINLELDFQRLVFRISV